jgi:hypothetical protein
MRITTKALIFVGSAAAIGGLYDALFGCHHPTRSFPLTPHKNAVPKAAKYTGSYVTCLDCGKEFPYDWATMEVISIKEAKKRYEEQRRVDPHYVEVTK